MQHIKDAFSVNVYETHGRIALEAGDLDEFLQCHARLKELYASGIAGSMEEFTSYGVLHSVIRRKKDFDVGTTARLSDLRPDERAHPCVSHSVAVIKAVLDFDFYAFFQLYKSAPNMSAYLMDFQVCVHTCVRARVYIDVNLSFITPDCR